MNTSNKILLVLATFTLAFIIAMIVIFCIKGSVPDTLIQYTLGAGGVEVLMLAFIKVSKVISENKYNINNRDDDFVGNLNFNKEVGENDETEIDK
jgi:hypothetical protein